MRGGKREGAGRKSATPGTKRTPVSFSLSPEAAGKVAQLREKGENISQIVDDFFRKL